MQWQWLLILTAAAKGAESNDACLSSIKVVDNFLTDEESRILLAGVNEKVPNFKRQFDDCFDSLTRTETVLYFLTISTAQGGCGSFKDRKLSER